MTKIDIFSGFLGAGKTTLIKKLISEAYKGENLVLIENEFGEIGIDGGFLKDAGIQITEMNSGCICCTLVGDFGTALKQVISQYHPDRILIEPSGVGKLSDVMVAVEKAVKGEAELGATVAVADATKVKLYMKNFGEFYNNQIETAGCIVLSRTQSVKEEKLKAAVELIRAHNDHATLVTTPWDELTGAQLKQAMESNPTLDDMMQELIAAHEQEEAEHEAEHHHHHDEHEHDHDHDEHETTSTSITIITITTPTTCSPPGAAKRPRPSPRMRSARISRRWTTHWNTASSSARRASCLRWTDAGSTLTTCPAKSTCVTARLT